MCDERNQAQAYFPMMKECSVPIKILFDSNFRKYF